MKFQCVHCAQHLEADLTMVGCHIPCPACQHDLVIPAMKSGKSETNGPGHRTFLRYAVLSVVGLLVVGGSLFITFGEAVAAKTTSLGNKSAPNDIQVYPADISLTYKSDRQSLVVQATYPDGRTRDVTAEAQFSPAKKGLIKIAQATAYPIADGATSIKVTYRNLSQSIPVKVANSTFEPAVSFKLDVVPVFTKAGCNAGACHGASRGKDGFRLSLFGFDPDSDYQRLTREVIGRRVNLALPEESLVVEKGLGKVPHGGGERFKEDSELYRTLVSWISAGVPKDATNVTQVTRIEIMPKQAVLEGSNATQRLSVRAYYSDGSDRDVTSLAAFFSSHDGCARVNDHGQVTSGQRGEAYVLARFDTFTTGAQIIVIPDGIPYTFPPLKEQNYIDTLVYAKLKKLRILPSEVCDDATFLRRVHVDLTGILPTPEALESFVKDTDSGKRSKVVDALLEQKEFVDLWVMKFAELLQIRSDANQFSQKSALLYYNWLQEQFAEDKPVDEVVRKLLTASGSNFRNPASSYFQVEKDVLKTAENAAQVFMGMRIQCAQCHNHPFDRWTMNDYYGFAAFFPQVGRKPAEDPREVVIYDKPDGEVKHPVTGRAVAPKFLGGIRPEINAGENRRDVLARWLTSPENPAFARNLGNIIWAHFLGRGIIEPVDDARISNPPSNPELLEALGQHLIEYQYDLKKLARDICNSRTYHLSTRPNPTNEADDRNFSHAKIRRIRAEFLLDCISQVTETRDKFRGLPRGAHAVEIGDGNESNYFLTTFGRATRASVCSCEVKAEPNLSQALHLLNGDTVHNKIQEGGVVKRLVAAGKTNEEIINQLYLRSLGRKPDDKERVQVMQFFKPGSNREVVLHDLFWSLLNSKEFIFNH